MSPVSLGIEEVKGSVCLGCVPNETLDLLEHAYPSDSSVIAIFLLWPGEIFFLPLRNALGAIPCTAS